MWIGAAVCGRCGEPGPRHPLRCRRCGALGRSLARARSALVHAAVAARLIRAWKDEPRPALVEVAARCLLATVRRPGGVLVPVPMVPDRAAWRGVDAPRDLACRLGAAWNLPCRTLLERVGSSSQRGRSAAARRRNAGRSFRASGAAPSRVILIDDVMTTGATLRACAARLREAGAETIEALTVTRVPCT